MLDVLCSERFCDAAPAQVWATLLDEGTYLASVSTMYRLLRQQALVRERRAQARRPPAHLKPELVAHAPNQVWSWDITKLAGPHKWTWFHLYVMLRAVAQRLAPQDDIRMVRYFTANVSAPDVDATMPQRQQAYLRALRTLPDTSIHLGQFVMRPKPMPVTAQLDEEHAAAISALGLPLHRHRDGNLTVRVWRTEEKGSDVNLATFLLADTFRGGGIR